MRLKTAAVILTALGIGLMANLLIDNGTMAPSQLEKVRTVCVQCHSEVPKYGTASNLHVKKASFNCSRCHSDNNALRATENIHTGLRWLGVGAVLFALIGIIVNSFMVNRRGKVT